MHTQKQKEIKNNNNDDKIKIRNNKIKKL